MTILGKLTSLAALVVSLRPDTPPPPAPGDITLSAPLAGASCGRLVFYVLSGWLIATSFISPIRAAWRRAKAAGGPSDIPAISDWRQRPGDGSRTENPSRFSALFAARSSIALASRSANAMCVESPGPGAPGAYGLRRERGAR